ncbi:MAG: hypothetical protein JWM93_2619 [Frankiales bacterium]|nr:hypothetical protein [Frankiales bacterium]
MTEPFDDTPSGRTALALYDLRQHVDVGPVPDVRAAVRARLEQLPSRPRPLARPRLLRRRAMAGVAALAAAFAVTLGVSPAARAALSDFFSFAGVEFRPPGVPQSTASTGASPAPGAPTPTPTPTPPRTPTTTPALTVSEAGDRAGFRVLVPSALGIPDGVTLSTGGRVVTLTYRGRGTGGTDLRLDEFVAGGLAPYFVKMIDPDKAEYVEFDGKAGIWVREPHEIATLGSGGEVEAGTLRVAARTLVWLDDAVTVRMEGVGSRDEAITVATTVD